MKRSVRLLATVSLAFISTRLQYAYSISDSINADQNIVFHWTVDDNTFGGQWHYSYKCNDGTQSSDNVATGTFNWRRKDGIGNQAACSFTFEAPATATDWNQTVGTTGGGGQSTVSSGNIKKDSPWHFEPLSALTGLPIRIPDLAPVVSGPEVTLYTAVNLPLYLEDNPFGFLGGNWSVGQTLSELGVTIANGQIAGVQGIYFATTPFDFNPDPSGPGFSPEGGDSTLLDSNGYPYEIEIIADHTTPEPSTLLPLTFLGLVIFGYRAIRRSPSCH